VERAAGLSAAQPRKMQVASRSRALWRTKGPIDDFRGIPESLGVFPAGGWWKDHLKTRAGTEIPYSVVITIDVGDADLDVYSLVSARIPAQISVDAT
jgi:hypothetical protein